MGSKNRQGCCCGGTPRPPYECTDYCDKYQVDYVLTVVAVGFGTSTWTLAYLPTAVAISVGDGTTVAAVNAHWVANGTFGGKPFRFYWFCSGDFSLGGAIGRANLVSQLDNPAFIYGSDWCVFGATCSPLHYSYASFTVSGCESSVGWSGLQTPATFYIDP